MIKRTQELWERHIVSRFTVTGLPLLAVGILGSVGPFFIEPIVLETKLISWQWLLFRVAYNVSIFALAFWRPHIPDTIEEKLFGKSAVFWKRWIAWGLSLSIYRLPIYSAFAILFGYYWLNVFEVCLYYAIENLVLGWPYLFLTDRCRRGFSKKLEAQQP